MPAEYPGIFIVFEGLDGAGCTTQMKLLEQALTARGYPVTSTKEPSNGPFGATIRLVIEERLQSHAVALALAFAADRIDHLKNEANGIVKALKEGKVVLCDRYVLSSLAYQNVFIEDLEWLQAINRFAFNPDLTVFIDTPVEECLNRIAARSSNDELFHKSNVLKAVRRNYIRLLEDEQGGVGDVLMCDGCLSRDELRQQIADKTSAIFQQKGYATLFSKK